MGGGDLPDLLQYYIEGGLPNLLQYYIGGFFKVYYNITDLVGIWKGLDHFQYYICFYVGLKVRILSQIWRKKTHEYATLGKHP